MIKYNISMSLNKCRLCLNAGILTNIFEKHGEVMISTKIMSLAKVEICPGDGFPDKVCLKCLKQLNSCLNFIEQCESVDLKLRAINNETVYQDSNESLVQHKESSEGTGENALKDEVFTDDSTLSESIDSLPKNEFYQTNVITKNQKEQCSTCGKVLSSQYRLKMHMRIHTEESLPIKDEFYQTNGKKKRKAQKGQCPTCGKVLSSPYRLKMHMRIHTGEKPHSCPDCDKSFTEPETLKSHRRVHTGEKPKECTICGAMFAQYSGLLTHKRKHTGQLPYVCTLCPRRFRTWGNLQYHIRRHTGETSFECDICSRAFITRGSLKQHILSHTGEKPHVCSVCGTRFGRESNLKRHVKHQHNGEKPYSCNICSHKFAQRSDFERHKKKHEKQKS